MMGTKTSSWVRLERKEQPSDPEAVLFRTCEERVEATRLCLQSWKRYFEEPRKILFAHFERLAAGADKDLEALAGEGVNPHIIIRILYRLVWLRKIGDIQYLRRRGVPCQQQIRRLSSADYWVNQRAALKKANKLLSNLMSFTLPKMAAQGILSGGEGPFVTVCKCAAAIKEKTEELLNTIEELKLCEDGWLWGYDESGIMKPIPTGRRGMRKSGRDAAGARRLHWGYCAAELHYYLKGKTGKSHWGTIARLLHFAGFKKEFPTLIPRDGEGLTRERSDLLDARWKYRARVRKRVKVLLGQKESRCDVIKELYEFESAHEVNPDIPEAELRRRVGRLRR